MMIFTEEYFIEQNKEQGARNKVSFIFISRHHLCIKFVAYVFETERTYLLLSICRERMHVANTKGVIITLIYILNCSQQGKHFVIL